MICEISSSSTMPSEAVFAAACASSLAVALIQLKRAHISSLSEPRYLCGRRAVRLRRTRTAFGNGVPYGGSSSNAINQCPVHCDGVARWYCGATPSLE